MDRKNSNLSKYTVHNRHDNVASLNSDQEPFGYEYDYERDSSICHSESSLFLI